MISFYTYDNPHTLPDTDFWKSIQELPHICATKTLADSLRSSLECVAWLGTLEEKLFGCTDAERAHILSLLRRRLFKLNMAGMIDEPLFLSYIKNIDSVYEALKTAVLLGLVPREPVNQCERAFWALFKIFTRQQRFNPTKNSLESSLSSVLPFPVSKIVIHGLCDFSPAQFALVRTLTDMGTDILFLVCKARGFKKIYSPCNKLQSLFGVRAGQIVCADKGEYPSRRDALRLIQTYDHTNIDTFATSTPDTRDYQEYVPVLFGHPGYQRRLGPAQPYFMDVENHAAFSLRLKHYKRMYDTVQNMRNDLGEKLRLLSFYRASRISPEQLESLDRPPEDISPRPKDFFELPGAVLRGGNIALSHLSDIYVPRGNGLPWPLTPELLHACGNSSTNTYLYFRLCRPAMLMYALFHTLYFSKTPVCVLPKGFGDAGQPIETDSPEDTPYTDASSQDAPYTGGPAFSRFEKMDFYLCPEKFYRDFICADGIAVEGYDSVRRFFEYLIVDQVWQNHQGTVLEHPASARMLASRYFKKLKDYFPFFDADAENRILENAAAYIFYHLLEGKNRLRAYAPSHASILLMFGAAVYPAPQEHVHPDMEHYRKTDKQGDTLLLHRIRPEGQQDIDEAMHRYLLSDKRMAYLGKWCRYCRHHILCPEYRKNHVLYAE